MNLLVALGCLAMLSVAFGNDDEHWEQHKLQHNLQFHSDHHHNKSKANFHKAKQIIEFHNQQFHAKKVSYSMQLNHLSHLDEEEMQQHRGLKQSTSDFHKRTLSASQMNINGVFIQYETVTPTPGYTPPASYDVETRTNGNWKVPVREQKCGCCWAFAAAASVEGAAFIQKKITTGTLSPQQLMDCSRVGNRGCHGGAPIVGLDYILKNPTSALATEVNYPFQGVDSTCNKNAAGPFTNVPKIIWAQRGSEAAVKEALVKYGPLAVGVHSNTNGFNNYHSGIFDGGSCTTQTDHAVLLVGYGVDNNKLFWRIKNQWGPRWGENGYMRIIRNGNICGLLDWAVGPLFN